MLNSISLKIYFIELKNSWILGIIKEVSSFELINNEEILINPSQKRLHLPLESGVIKADPSIVPEVNHEQGLKPGASVFLYARSKRDNYLYVLLAHNKKRQMWSSAGGYVDAGETYAQAGARELYEETGRFYGFDHKNNQQGIIPVLPKDLVNAPYSAIGVGKGKALHYTFFIKVKYIANCNAILHAISNSNLPKQFNEIDSFMWVPLHALMACLAQSTKLFKQNYKGFCTYRRPIILHTGKGNLKLNGAFVRSITTKTAWDILLDIY
jgi:hypothetical protein